MEKALENSQRNEPKSCSYFCLQAIPDPLSLESIQTRFSSVQSLSCVGLFVTPWTAALQASLSISNSQSLLKLMSIESVIPSNHLILCHPLILLPSIFPSISSVQFSCSVVSDSLRPHELQHTRPPYPSQTPGVYSNSCPLSQ